MASRRISLLIDGETFDRLQATSKRMGQTPSSLAESLLEEGLRMEAHPGVVFRSGPAGRRPGLAAGPDVWEVARLLGSGAVSEEAIQRAASLMDLTLDQVRTAMGYYLQYRPEIDEWIQQVDQEAAQAEATWEHQPSHSQR